MTRTATIHAFPIIPRPTALVRRAMVLEDRAANIVPTIRPRIGFIALRPDSLPGRAARFRWIGLRKGRVQWRGVIWLRRAGSPLSLQAALHMVALIVATGLTAASIAAVRL